MNLLMPHFDMHLECLFTFISHKNLTMLKHKKFLPFIYIEFDWKKVKIVVKSTDWYAWQVSRQRIQLEEIAFYGIGHLEISFFEKSSLHIAY